MDILERISNLLQKNLLSVKKIIEIKDDVDDYTENSNEQDYQDNAELFDELELDKYDSSASASKRFIL